MFEAFKGRENVSLVAWKRDGQMKGGEEKNVGQGKYQQYNVIFITAAVKSG